ncbi:hypothetical protein MKS88_002742 [Plasmodium brasilianum]|nr:hypothetical protein MKS88_002742 [Plasmodium brasilianum]
MLCQQKNKKNIIDLKKKLNNTLVVIGLIIEMILSDDNILEIVSINDIYKTIFYVFRSRYNCILNELELCEEKNEGLLQKGHLLQSEEDKEVEMVRGSELVRDVNTVKNVQVIKDAHGVKNAQVIRNVQMVKEIRLKFSQIFYSPPKRGSELMPISNLRCIKHAIAGCLYMHGKITSSKISLRNVLNNIDYNIYLLNKCAYTTKCVISKEEIQKFTVHINHYEPIIKENIYHEKEESLKMEKLSLYILSFKLSNNIFKYSLLYELMFITRSPFIINKFLFSVFNDVICIPNIKDKYNDIDIVISCILFVNHFFYHINKHCKIVRSPYFMLVKKMYLSQVEKIVNIFILLNPVNNHLSQMKNIISLTKKICNLYSFIY